MAPTYQSQVLDHLGLVAAMYPTFRIPPAPWLISDMG